MNALDAAFRFNETALKVGAQRQQVIASNMANADTPGFQANQLNFADALARVSGEGTNKAATMTATRSGHIDPTGGKDGVTLSTADLIARRPAQPSIDGNTVDMDVERGAFADNTVRYEASFSFLNHQIKTLMSAIQG